MACEWCGSVIRFRHVRCPHSQPQLTAAILLRESYRDGDRVKSRTLANLSHWPEDKINALRRVLKGEELVSPAEQLRIERSLPHGHVAAVLGMARQLGLHHLVPDKPRRLARLALALIVARVIEPAAKLATARQLSAATAAHSLGELLDLGAVDEDELYQALDLLGTAQPGIEATLEASICVTARWCSTISPPAIWRDVIANWRGMVTAATVVPTSCRSCSVCCAPPTAARWRWRCSKATPPTRARWPRKSTN